MKSDELRIRDIPIKDIDRSRNHRIPIPGDDKRLEAMKRSIEACDQLQPVRVYERGEDQKDKKHKEPYILGFGNRRCKALELLDRKTVQAIVFPPASDTEIAQARAVENVHRQDITPLEEVQAVADTLEAINADETFAGDPFDEAAARLGCEVAWVKDRDYLHRLTKPVQKFALRSGLPAGHLRELAKVGDPADQMRLACELSGAPAQAFPFDPKETKVTDWQRQLQEIYFAELQDGKASRWPLSRLKEQVAKVQLSLRIIPWEFDHPVEFGATKLRKCAGCPHNSESDRMLFEIDEDTANPQGYCLYASCYNAKHGAVEAAKEQVFKKIKVKEDQTPAAIRKIAPAWIKETSVVAHVKRQLEKSANGQSSATASKPRNASHQREFTEHEQALQKFTDAFHAWEKRAWTAVFKGINAEPSHRVSWCVLLGVPALWDHPRMKIPVVQVYAEPATQEPELPPLAKAMEDAIVSAFKGTRTGWVDVLKDQEQPHPDHRGGFGIPHPRILELLAEAVKVKVPSVPQWKPAAILPTAPEPKQEEPAHAAV